MRAITTLAAALALAGAAVGDDDVKKTLTVDGRERTCFVHVPLAYDGAAPAPLVFGLHGGGGIAEKFDKLTGLDETADREGFIAVYPQGLDKHWNDGRVIKRLLKKYEDADDVAFLVALRDRLAADYNVDAKRVYVAGISNGAMMSYRLAADRPDVFAAAAAVAGTVAVALPEEHPPAGPAPVMMILGDADPLVPYEGGEIKVFGFSRGEVLSAAASVAFWVENNGAETTPVETYYPDAAPDDGTRVRREDYAGPAGADVVLVTVEGGGHTWPGGWQSLSEKIVGKTSRDINANDVIWEFFESHPRP